MSFPDFENIGLLFLVSELWHEYIMHIKMKKTKKFCFYFLIVCLQMLYWIVIINEKIIAICFQMISELMNDNISYGRLKKTQKHADVLLKLAVIMENFKYNGQNTT